MTPTTSLDVTRILGTNVTAIANTNLPYGIRLYNVNPDGTLGSVAGLEALNPDLYVTIDVSPIINQAMTGQIDVPTRNNLVGFMLYLSDRNADIWENRVFAYYKVRQGTVGAIRDFATVGAGTSALIIPPVAVGMSAANLIIGPISDQIDTTLYSKDTVETMLKAIAASRHVYKNTIRQNFTNDVPHYDMFAALDQLRHYDSLVSFRKGLAYAATLADNQTEAADTVAATNLGSNPIPTGASNQTGHPVSPSAK